MTSRSLAVATAIVRAWTRLLTWRLEPEWRDRRRAEIDSDLWEFEHDPARGAAPARHLLLRLALGLPDDLHWRVEHSGMAWTRTWRTAVLAALAAFLVMWWVSGPPPARPQRPGVRIFLGAPMPPPPAPPPSPALSRSPS